MAADDSKPLPAFGFLTAVEDLQHGFFGGYLVLSSRGRPLEFHCSTPVLPTPAQRILYGTTLRPYVLGEIIGPALVDRTELAVPAVVTDQPDMLGLALVRPTRLACLEFCPRSPAADPTEPSRVEAVAEPVDAPVLALGDYRLFGTSLCNWSADQLRHELEPLCRHVDLSEPFERIREAISEARRASEPQPGDSHEPSAAA